MKKTLIVSAIILWFGLLVWTIVLTFQGFSFKPEVTSVLNGIAMVFAWVAAISLSLFPVIPAAGHYFKKKKERIGAKPEEIDQVDQLEGKISNIDKAILSISLGVTIISAPLPLAFVYLLLSASLVLSIESVIEK